MAVWERRRVEPNAVSEAPIDEVAQRDRSLPDIDWATRPPGSVASTFDAPSGQLAVVSMGEPDAERVLLAPGVTGSKEDFTLMLPELSAAGYFVQSYDLAGQYESAAAGPGPGGRYDYDLFVADLIALLESGRPAHVLGYSFAGTVAQIALVRRPELFLSLTLLATPPMPGNGFRGVKWLGPFTRFASGRIVASLMRWGVVNNLNGVPPKRLEFVRYRFGFTSMRSMRDIIEIMKHAPDLREEVAAAGIPKLVAVGSHDLWPLKLHELNAKSIGAKLAIYPTGHSPCETKPYQLSRAMVALFRSPDSHG